jgi:hypothetical protein
MGHIIMGSVIRVIRRSSESAGILRFSKFPVIFPVLREFGTASLRRIGGESNGSAHKEIAAIRR